MERVTQIARDVAKEYAAIVDNDRTAMMMFAGFALAAPYVKANYGTVVLVLAWCAIGVYWGVTNAPRSKRLDETFHKFTDETGCNLLID